MTKQDFDIAIVGAGPAGTATCIALQGSDLRIALLDKSTFPRDKICGDALSPDVLSQLNKLPLDCGPLFESMEEKIFCKSLKFISPNFSEVSLKLDTKNITGYISKRMHFDNFLYERAVENSNVTSFAGLRIKALEVDEDRSSITLEDDTEICASDCARCRWRKLIR